MMNTRLNITIIGAGNGGRAFAAYFSRKGHNVTLVYRTLNYIRRIKQSKKIHVKGILCGTYSIMHITDDYQEAIRRAHIIMYVIPASVHHRVTVDIAPYLRHNQIILLNPGRTWGALEVKNILKFMRPNIHIFVGETQTLLFTCRKITDRGVEIIKIKDRINACFYPEKDNQKVGRFMQHLIPQLHIVKDIRITSLNNIGAIIHPTITILNSGAISRVDDFHFYVDGVTPAISKVIQQVDQERMHIMRALGLKTISFLQWAHQSYGSIASTYFEMFRQIKPYQGIKAPQSLQMRYITEDVPTGLVPLSSLGKFLGIPTPTINSIIGLANALFSYDFYQRGRTLDNIRIPKRLVHKSEINVNPSEAEEMLQFFFE